MSSCGGFAGERLSVCVCTFSVIISFIYSSAGRSADASQKERGGTEAECEIKCEEKENQKSSYEGNFVSRALGDFFI